MFASVAHDVFAKLQATSRLALNFNLLANTIPLPVGSVREGREPYSDLRLFVGNRSAYSVKEVN